MPDANRYQNCEIIIAVQSVREKGKNNLIKNQIYGKYLLVFVKKNPL